MRLGDSDLKTLFITAGTSVYRVRPFAISTGNNDSEVLKKFKLFQNYPNPFNPSTNISYSIPTNSQVVLKIYDALGKEIMTIENRERTAGTYVVPLNARNLASGVYYYKLSADHFSEVKKLVVIK